MSYLSDFYRQHPEYRRLRVVRRTCNSIHFEIAPGVFEAHFLSRPLFERVSSGLWLPVSPLAKAMRLGIQLAQQPRVVWELAKALPFATTDTFQPDGTTGKDTIIAIVVPDNNYGTNTNFNAGTAGTGATSVQRSLLEIDFSLGAGNTISVATLTLYCNAENNAIDANVEAHRALRQWYAGDQNGAAPPAGHDGSTWNHRNVNGDVHWGTTGGQSATDYAASATASTSITGTGTTFDWNVLTDVQAWYAGTATNYGWFLINANEVNNDTLKQFVSSAGATSSQRPKLVITYTAAAVGRSFAVIVG